MENQKLKSPAKVMAKWLKRSSRIQNAHYDAAATLMRYHRWTGGALVVLSMIEGSTFLVELTKSTPLSPYVIGVTAFIGLIVAVLAAMQAFMSFETRSRLHHIAGVKYGAIKRQIEARQSTVPSDEDAAAYLTKLGPDWDALAEESEPIPLSVWNRILKKEKAKKKHEVKKEAQTGAAAQAK